MPQVTPPADDSKSSPTLTDRQVLALVSIAQHALLNPEFAADFIVNPREILKPYSMSEADISQIVNYFRFVDQLVKQDQHDDWIG